MLLWLVLKLHSFSALFLLTKKDYLFYRTITRLVVMLREVWCERNRAVSLSKDAAFVFFFSVCGWTHYFSSFSSNLVLHNTNLQPRQEDTLYWRCQCFWKNKMHPGSVPHICHMLHFLLIDSTDLSFDQAELAANILWFVCSNWKDWHFQVFWNAILSFTSKASVKRLDRHQE